MTYRRKPAFPPMWSRTTRITSIERDSDTGYPVAHLTVYGEKLWYGVWSADRTWTVHLSDSHRLVPDDEPVIRVMRAMESEPATYDHPWEQIQIAGQWYDAVDQAVWFDDVW